MQTPRSPGMTNIDNALFRHVCDLFEALLTVYARLKGKKRRQALVKVTMKWFGQFKTGSLYTLMRLLVPGEDHARVYHLKECRLAGCLSEALGLKGTSRGNFLMNWRRGDDRFPSSQGDLGQVLFAIVQNESLCSKPTLTIQRISRFLDFMVEDCKATSTNNLVQIKRDLLIPELRQILLSSTSAEAKWLVRIILKDLRLPFHFRIFFRAFHPHFYRIFQMQRDLQSACDTVNAYIQSPNGQWSDHVKPKLGVCIAGMECGRGTGITQVTKRMANRVCHVETKYDGERLQAHIDRSWPEQIRIFSKSGRNSTLNRYQCHQPLLASLNAEKAIIEGELLVYNELTMKIESFGTVPDFAPNSRMNTKNRHLMVILYDILHLNGENLMHRPYKDRRRVLESVLKERETFVELVKYTLVDFTNPNGGSSLLADLFKRSVENQEEGLIIKDANSRYIPGDRSHWLKLKKDYIEGFGDTAEFAIVGASGCPDRPGCFSEFTISVLLNKQDLVDDDGDSDVDLVPNSRPYLLAVFTVKHGLSDTELSLLQPILRERSCLKPTDYELDYAVGFNHRPDILLSSPIICELLGSGLVRDRGQRHFTLRFPRIRRLFIGRPLTDVLSFDELQSIGDNAQVDSEKINGKPVSRQHRIVNFDTSFNDSDDIGCDSGEDGLKEPSDALELMYNLLQRLF